jgi:hypothetical protein
MTFLANLVGSEHIERFIPLADPASERVAPVAPPRSPAPGPGRGPSIEATGTREMPHLPAGQARAPIPVGTHKVARTERAAPRPPAPANPEPPTLTEESIPAPERSGPSAAAREQVIADAARLVQWGRKWFELAEIIAGMADRPHLTEVRRILKDNKAVIDKRAGRG